ncbi:glycosyltransferase family 2 protein [Candidatus Saccharibacteria bacterium]|nr:glycosyltransferase family 2 protein [Candidatus Saccharibacteria bacterium]
MDDNLKNPLVSIVTPVYNGEDFFAETIKTVLLQSYTNWEWIIVDDGSTDKTLDIIKECKSKKIKVIKSEGNDGAAKSRNKGIKASSGDFLCFLDADDLWESKKIEEQINFMREKDCAFSFTSYEFADASGKPNGRIVSVPTKITYKQALKNTTIWTSTVMFDMRKMSKEDVMMPDVWRGQDTATWWKVLKKIDYACGLNEVLSYYRRGRASLSSNKFTALKRTWNLYRNVERFGIVKSTMYFISYCFNAVRRRI